MKYWSAIAVASGVEITTDEMERVVRPLQNLEEAFRPLASSLRFDDEPATKFDAAEEVE